jgi:hypothetical protein
LSQPPKGKDLSALKARLAKKSAGADEPPAIPPPGESLPEPEPEPAAAPMAAAQPAADYGDDDGYDAPVAADDGYDAPASAARVSSPAPEFSSYAGGDVDVGEIKPRRSLGLVLVAGLAALAVGTAAGYLLGVANNKRGNLVLADAKRAEVAAEINAIREARARVSLGVADVKKAIGEDPSKGAAVVAEIIAKLGASPDPTKLFGWQLAYVDPERVKRVLALYRDAHGLRADLQDLQSLLEERAGDLAASAAPLALAVTPGESGADLVVIGRPICEGEGGPAPCADAAAAEGAVAFEVSDAPGGEPRVVEKAALRPLVPEGGIYAFAIEGVPARKAFDAYAARMSAVEGRLEGMAAVEKFACKAFKDDGACPELEEEG